MYQQERVAACTDHSAMKEIFMYRYFPQEVQWVAAGWVHEHSMKQTPKTIKLLLLMDDQ